MTKTLGSALIQHQPISTSQEAAVRELLADILASPEFRASQKCQAFLRYVVEQTLAGHPEMLKERVIGAEVFGRAPGFETAGDSIVRVKATEVRRRLAKYRQDNPGSGLWLELPTGSYAPHFHWERPGPRAIAAAAPARPASRRAWLGVATGGAAVAAAWKFWPASPALDRFWAPLISSSSPVVVCTSAGPMVNLKHGDLADLLRKGVAPGATLRLDDLSLSSQGQTSWSTVLAIADVSRLLGAARKEYVVRMASELSFEQIRQQPLVVIGMFSNPWTVEITRELRFRLEAAPGERAHWVRDTRVAEPLRTVHGVYPHVPMPVDYALVTRLMDPARNRRVIAIAGISGLGTRVAADFATNPRSWEQFDQTAPAGWEKRNLQILLETRIIGSTPSPPSVLATHIW